MGTTIFYSVTCLLFNTKSKDNMSMNILHTTCVQGHIGQVHFNIFGDKLQVGVWGCSQTFFERQTLNFLHSGGFLFIYLCLFCIILQWKCYLTSQIGLFTAHRKLTYFLQCKFINSWLKILSSRTEIPSSKLRKSPNKWEHVRRADMAQALHAAKNVKK